jgi:predicted nucleic acid-binding protein
MEANILVDSSFFISRFRNRLDPFRELAASDSRYEFYSCGVVVAEVSCGMTVPKHYQQIRQQFAVMCWVPTTDQIWHKVTELTWNLARRGIAMKLPDLVIAVSALEADAVVLTLDTDFRNVPGLRIIDTLDTP